MYDEKSKNRTIHYLAISREKLCLNLPLGTKDRWKDYASERGISLTELLKTLIEEDMKKHNFKG